MKNSYWSQWSGKKSCKLQNGHDFSNSISILRIYVPTTKSNIVKNQGGSKLLGSKEFGWSVAPGLWTFSFYVKWLNMSASIGGWFGPVDLTLLSISTPPPLRTLSGHRSRPTRLSSRPPIPFADHQSGAGARESIQFSLVALVFVVILTQPIPNTATATAMVTFHSPSILESDSNRTYLSSNPFKKMKSSEVQCTALNLIAPQTHWKRKSHLFQKSRP